MRVARSLMLTGALAALAFGVVACGGGGKKVGVPGREPKPACSGTPLSNTAKLPSNWPDLAAVTFTRQATQGPTEVVEGYFEGDIEAAHEDFKRELEEAGFTILFDEREDRDAEVSWEGRGRSGQVALREECGRSDKIYVHITNRPAG